MKIIDILVKKANGTLEDGFKFKYNAFIYTYYKQTDEIVREDGWDLGHYYYIERYLNDTVEVIEENKEIEELEFEEGTYIVEQINQIADKLNELVRAVNEINKEREVK